MADKDSYRIGHVSKILGIAPETIRHYERQNVMSPSKDKESGYRLFSMKDVYSISRIRSYMKLGFSMAQAQKMINDSSVEEIQTAMLDKAQEIQKSIQEQMTLLQTLYRRVQSIQVASETVGRFSIRKMPAMQALSMHDDQDHLDLNLPLAEWYNRQDIAYPYCIFGLDENNRIYIDRMGLCVNESEIKGSGLEESVNDHLPAQECLYTSALVRDSDTMEKTQEIADYLIEHFGDTCKRTIIHRTVAALSEDEEGAYFVELWMPLKR